MSTGDSYIQGDTIAAIATAAGAGGIGILRVSGPQAREAAARLFQPGNPGQKPDALPPRSLVLGQARDARGRALDRVLAVFFPAPHSYTTEDVLEIQSHGGPAVLRELLAAALHAGCRLARPGEFTLRAYLGGRLDLSQAEAVAQLINASSGAEARLAHAGLAGGLARRLAPLRAALTSAAAMVEAAIDFPEETGEILAPDLAARLRAEVLEPLEALAQERSQRRVWREGALVVLCGRPNVGKSSLFNALLGFERAIVTSIAGTTRDAIEEAALLGGVVCRLSDTAGLGLEPGELEALGRAAARERLGLADLALVVLDLGQPLSAEDRAVLAATQDLPRVIAANKCDLVPAWDPASVGEDACIVSAKRGDGLPDLAEAIGAALTGGQAEPAPGEAVASRRQAEALAACAQATARAVEGLALEEPPCELISVDLAEALAFLGQVDGIDAPEAVIEAIFSEFCVGKQMADHLPKTLAGRQLPPDLEERWEQLCALLLKWNRTHNLTGHRDPDSARQDLFLDSLALVPQVRGETLLDIGSGAGFPGLVLALALPGLHVTLLEPRAKRVSFQKHAARTLGLAERVNPVQGRAGEALLDQRFSTITLRAVTDIPGSLALARPYLATGGAVLLPRGAKDAALAEGMGLEVVEYTLGPDTPPRIIAIYSE